MDMNFLNIQPSAVNPKKAQTPGTDFERKARDTADSFEAVFLSQILKSMSTGLKADGAFSGGHGEDVFRDVLNEEIGKQISKNGGIGLSDAVYREILKTQEVDYK
ncbi:rod-binding protein [Paremcibacter congregatus]|uniref:Flagellar protein FlgJ N-terminal domain-containing protein n=1 Tax=Paremcibacter congregatus TaxID=2043170 RepID=A0A2G4YLY3_9PROT|nr:rod-binding protein [Paremcibacter congregatus]PHZ83334.1 hypothetical protein CRD36_17360 [Paremcibacter congregatus]QDE28193.1 hypothetical protein FIV45_13430 [Paremcibacter congregatus]